MQMDSSEVLLSHRSLVRLVLLVQLVPLVRLALLDRQVRLVRQGPLAP